VTPQGNLGTPPGHFHFWQRRIGVRTVYISSTQIAMADDCRFQHWLRFIRKVQVSAEPANLVFGRCIDASVREYLTALATNEPPPDPVTRFRVLWQGARANSPMTYAATHLPEEFEAVGLALMRALPGAWEETGFQVAQDQHGRPMLNVSLQASLGRRGELHVVLTGTPDLLIYTRSTELAVLDVKSAATVHTVRYALRADQLTAYQALADVNGDALGLPPVARLGFWDFLKRKSACIEPPVLVPRRHEADLEAFRDKVFWLAEDVARGRFPKASRMQFNTPCDLCDFAQFCIDGNEEGLVFPGDAPKKPTLTAAAFTVAAI
jgi:hypothetical protein